MPGMDGVQLLKEVRSQWPNLPVILFNAGGRHKEESALYAGAYAFVEKPIDVDQLLKTIEAALQQNDLGRRVHAHNNTSMLNLKLKFPELELDSAEMPDPKLRS